MSNKKIIAITSVIIILIISFYIFYLCFIKPVIIGEYTPKEDECINAYKCDCLNDTCICTFKKWFWENKMVCKRDIIKDKQLNK